MTTHDLTGQSYDGSVRVTLRPGFGIRINGEHVEGGPHYIPVDIAAELVHDGKAFPSPEEVVENGDPAVANSDPSVDETR